MKKNRSQYLKEYRHKKGISVKYRSNTLTDEQRVYNRKITNKLYKIRRKASGNVDKKILQMVYEDNIKKYGTLTCYLCLKAILFGNDHLEHKTPVSRGGSNDYENLGVACSSCNVRKYNKTVQEFTKQENQNETLS